MSKKIAFVAVVLAAVLGVGFVYQQNYTIQWDTTTVSDGPHTITVIAQDAAGNLAQDVRQIVVDNHAPTVTLVVPSTVKKGTSTTVTVDAWDAVGVLSGTLSFGGAPLTVALPYSTTFTPTKPGNVTITATAWDAVGHVGTASTTLKVTTK